MQPLGAIDRSRRNLRISRRRGWLRPGRSGPRSGQRSSLRGCCLQCLRHARSCLEPSVYDHNRRVPRSHQPQVQRKRSSWARCLRESASRQRPRTKVPIWIFTPHHDDASTGRNYPRRYGTRARNAIQQRFLRLVTLRPSQTATSLRNTGATRVPSISIARINFAWGSDAAFI